MEWYKPHLVGAGEGWSGKSSLGRRCLREEEGEGVKEGEGEKLLNRPILRGPAWGRDRQRELCGPSGRKEHGNFKGRREEACSLESREEDGMT